MKILAIETSGHTFSVALSSGSLCVSEVFRHSGLAHSERLVPTVEQVLAEARWTMDDLGAVAVTTGPGSFTGIRVGLSCAKTIAQTLGLPLIGIDTLEILAAGVPECGYTVYPVIDALRNELYVRGRNGVTIVTADALAKRLRKSGKKTLLVGNGAIAHREALEKTGGRDIVIAPSFLNFPRAGVLAVTAQGRKGVRHDRVGALYIRRSWAEEKGR